MKICVYPLCLILTGALLFPAGSTQSRTTRTESYTTTENSDRPAVTSRTETTESESSNSESSGGIISGTVDIVGKTLALPFRAVGGLIDLIF
jgi:hypothetical protein